MSYKVIKTTDGKHRGTIFEIAIPTIAQIKSEVESLFGMDVDTLSVNGKYIQLSNSNYTIILKEVS